jgi:MYXO-CTERM domain-containing protein
VTYTRQTMARPLLVSSLASLIALGCGGDPLAPPTAHTTAPATAASVADYWLVLSGPSAIEAIPDGTDPASPDGTRITSARVKAIEAAQAKLVPEVEARGAKVVAQLSRVANAIQVLARSEDLPDLERLPGVVRVEKVPLVEPALASAIPVVGAPAVWSKTTPVQGDGVTIGIIDTGIDYTHADFGGPGTTAAYTSNDSTIIEPGTFPTARVVGGWDFVGDDYDPTTGNSTPVPDPDPLDCTKPQSFQVSGGHGTHVSGIAAGGGVKSDGTPFTGPYDQSLSPSAFAVFPGVAPRANLYALKIFGCDGSTTALISALERAADPNKDGKLDDRLDVVNASLGTSFGISSPLTGTAVSNLVKAGTVVVVAAGNDGQTFYAMASPAVYPETIAVAASADNRLIGMQVTAPASIAGEYAAAEGGFTKRLADSGVITGDLVAPSPANGCSAFSNAAAVAGKIAIMDRGTCPFVKKFQNAVAAGAIAGVIVDNAEPSELFAMGGGDPGQISIPGVMISKQDGATINAQLAQGVSVTLDGSKLFSGAGSETLADFSARGPTADGDRLKPDISAPGFAIDSARVGSGTKARRSDGTSMASPFVAGAAALVREAKPAFGPLEVKAALVNSAKLLTDATGAKYSTTSAGSGRLAVDEAVDVTSTAASDPGTGDVGVSFGSLVVDEPASVKRSVTVTNHDGAAQTYQLAVEPSFSLPGVTVSVSPSELQVAAGETGTLELTLSLDPQALGSPGVDPATPPTQYDSPRQYLNEASGRLKLTPTSGPVLVVPYQGSVRAAAERKAQLAKSCGDAAGPVAVPLTGKSAHPDPVVTAFQLGTLDPVKDASATDPKVALIDIAAVGAASDLATAATFDEASVFFGVAIAGEWTTPARGPLSIVSIDIDTDKNGTTDYEIRTEALSKDGPYADVLVASTYPAGASQPSARRYVNMASADQATTEPFHNSVLVLVANLPDIGVGVDSPSFRYAAKTENPELVVGERTPWIDFDPSKPILDPAKGGTDGRPLYTGNSAVLVDVDPDAKAGGGPLELLLFHHTNVAGQRYEVVDLRTTEPTQQNLALSLTAPESVATGATSTLSLSVVNDGEETATHVTVTGSISGGTLTQATASAGSCAAGPDLDCDLGDLEPGASVTLSVGVRGGEGESVEVSAKTTSDLGCETNATDNSAKASITVIGPVARPPLSAHGGCGCRTEPSERSSRAAWLVAGLAALVLARRRQRGVRAAS